MSMTILPRHRPRARVSIAAVMCGALAVLAGGLAAGRPGSEAVARSLPAPRVVEKGQAAPPSSGRPQGTVDRPKRGMTYLGLRQSDKCPGGFLVAGDHRAAKCVHGPDPAPSGVDVRERRSLAALTSSASTELSVAGSVPCYGTGTDGSRVQAIYAVAADRADRYASLVNLFGAYAANADKAFNDSAALGGQQRHLRWVTDGACQLVVDRVVLSVTGDDSFGNMKAELSSLGYNRSDRKYMVWVDGGVYCGIANLTVDDRPGQDNVNNRGPTFARVDAGCWGNTASVEAHEIAHMLGGVQLSAPHSNGAGHCTDEYDRMCYNDGSGATLQYICASTMEPLLDCKGDDYFNVNPPTGSYLSSHWNIANSAYLASGAGGSPATASPTPTTASPTPTTASPTPTTASPTPTTASPTPTTASPTPTAATTTSVFTGSLNKRVTSRTFALTARAGTLTGQLQFTKARSMTASLTDSQGAVVATVSGPSVVSILSAVPSGVTSVTVTGSANANFTLTVTYPT
jgi:cell division septation protein DedD